MRQWVALAVVACRSAAVPDVDVADPLARAHTSPANLSVTAVSPGETYNLRIVGLPNSTYHLFRGKNNVAMTTCPPFQGLDDCPKVTNNPPGTGAPVYLGSVSTDATGHAGLATKILPAQTPLNSVVYFAAQADNDHDGITKPDDHTNVVTRNVVDSTTYDAAAPDAHNILVILADDLGVDRLEHFGAVFHSNDDGDTDSGLDTLATEGMIFESAWALPVCGPTRSTLLTGRLPRRTGWGWNGALSSSDGPFVSELDEGFVTLGELVHFSPWVDYSTAYFGKWQMSSPESFTEAPPAGPRLGANVQGFDWFEGPVNVVDQWFDDTDPPVNDLTYFNFGMYEDNDVTQYSEVSEYATSRQTQDAIDWIAVQTAPWLAVVSYNAPHDPAHVPPVTLFDTNGWVPAQFPTPPGDLRDAFRAAVQAMNREIDRLLLGINFADTVVIFTSDNGTPRWAAVSGSDPAAGEANLGRLKSSIYDGGIHVPLVVAGPIVDASLQGLHTTEWAHVADVFPTIATIAGVEVNELPSNLQGHAVPLGTVIDGHDLTNILNGTAGGNDRTFLYSEWFDDPGAPYDNAGVLEYPDGKRVLWHDTQPNYKLIVEECTGTRELYALDVNGDWDEDNNLAATDTGIANALAAEMTTIVAELEYDASGESWPASPVHTGCP